MTNESMPGRYSRVQAWAHDTLIGDRALNLHDYILEYGKLVGILAETRDRSLIDVGCGGGQAAIRYIILKASNLWVFLVIRLSILNHYNQ